MGSKQRLRVCMQFISQQIPRKVLVWMVHYISIHLVNPYSKSEPKSTRVPLHDFPNKMTLHSEIQLSLVTASHHRIISTQLPNQKYFERTKEKAKIWNTRDV